MGSCSLRFRPVSSCWSLRLTDSSALVYLTAAAAAAGGGGGSAELAQAHPACLQKCTHHLIYRERKITSNSVTLHWLHRVKVPPLPLNNNEEVKLGNKPVLAAETGLSLDDLVSSSNLILRLLASVISPSYLPHWALDVVLCSCKSTILHSQFLTLYFILFFRAINFFLSLNTVIYFIFFLPDRYNSKICLFSFVSPTLCFWYDFQMPS